MLEKISEYIMNTAAIKRMNIVQELSLIPENSLDIIKNYLDTMLTYVKVPAPKNESLKGIWKNTGLENISDFEHEIRTVRQELQDSILARQV